MRQNNFRQDKTMKAKAILNNTDETTPRHNLFNETRNKYKKVKNYIESMLPEFNWGSEAKKHFAEVRRQAMNCLHANTALDIIGYVPNSKPTLYRDCALVDKKNTTTALPKKEKKQ